MAPACLRGPHRRATATHLCALGAGVGIAGVGDSRDLLGRFRSVGAGCCFSRTGPYRFAPGPIRDTVRTRPTVPLRQAKEELSETEHKEPQ
jgi:hypothetical protein